MKLIVPLLCLLWSTVCNAGPIVSITQRLHDGDLHGSGTVIGFDDAGRTLVLTCGHKWRQGGSWLADDPDACVVYRAQLVAIDTTLDLGLLAIADGPDDAYPLAGNEPGPGARMSYGGFTDNGTRFVDGLCVCKEFNRDIVKIDALVLQGQSGGPILENGKVVGVIVGSYKVPENGARSCGVRLSVVRKFVEKHR